MKINKVSTFFLVLFCSITLPFEVNAMCTFVERDYKSRENNSYSEGVLTRTKINSDFQLVSFAIAGEVNNNQNVLSLKIPKQVAGKPNLLIREFEKEYLLDEIDEIKLSSENKDFYSFNWSSCVIKKAQVDIQKLRFFAILPGSQDILLPVIFGEGGKEYSFVFRTSKPTAIKSFQVKKEERVIYSTSNSSQIGEIILNWDGRDESKNIVEEAGFYNLLIEVEIRDRNGTAETYSEQVQFYHNHDLLK